MMGVLRWAAVSALLAPMAMAFQVPCPGLRVRLPVLRGSCRMSMREAGGAPADVSRRTALFQALVLLGAPTGAHAKKPVVKDDVKKVATISLDDFYAALEDQEVLKVEFDGAKFEVRL